MVEATNFVEKTLGKSLDSEQKPEVKESIPMYTPPPPPKQEFIPPQPQTIQQPVIQIVEKIVYKKQRIHGFFRTLTIIALLAIGFLMLGESTGLIELSINSFKLHQIFPVFIIFSTIVIRSYRGIFGRIFGLALFLTVFVWMFAIGVFTSLNPTSKRKSWDTIDYALATDNNLYLQTLIGNSYIEGNKEKKTLGWTRNSDRRLLVSSGGNASGAYLKLDEDPNRNVLQNYISNINLNIPNDKTIDLLYIKNLLWLHTIDLREFQWKMLKFHAGIDDVTIKIGNVLSGNRIEVQGAAANVQLDIPRNVGVIMYYKMLAGKFKAPEFEALTGRYYQSQNIATADSIVNIYVNLWLGNTTINRID